MSDQSLRIRALLDSQFAVVVAVFVVVAAAGGWLVYATHIDPGTERVERTASSWGVESEFEHRAVVTEVNPLYRLGSNLTGRSVYFADVTPRFEGAYEYSYNATGRGELNGSVELDVVMRGVEERRGSENVTVLWERTRTLDSSTHGSLAPGERVSVPFSVNATALANRTGQLEQRLGEPSDDTRLFLRATVNASGSVNGRDVERSRTHSLALAFDGGTYRVSGAGPDTETFERTTVVARERSYGPLRAAGGPLLLLFGVGGLGALAFARRGDRISLSPAERERLSYLDDRSEFDEWISTIELPDEAFGLPEATAGSLGSLVDFAIDTDNGVVESPDEEAFHVVHGDYLYSYRPPALASEPAVGRVDEAAVADAARGVHESSERALDGEAGGGEFDGGVPSDAFDREVDAGAFGDGSDADAFEEVPMEEVTGGEDDVSAGSGPAEAED